MFEFFKLPNMEIHMPMSQNIYGLSLYNSMNKPTKAPDMISAFKNI